MLSHFLIVQNVIYSQESDSTFQEKRKVIKEIFMSSIFDTFHKAEVIYIKKNELIDSNILFNNTLCLDKKIVVLANAYYDSMNYIVFSDLTMVDNTCRVQIEFVPNRSFLSVFMLKEDNIWKIANWEIN